MSLLPLPVDLETLSNEEMARIWSRGLLGYSKLVRTNPAGLTLSSLYSHLGVKHYNFEFRKDDVIILSYPKSGTTWASELVWAMMHPGKVNEVGNTHIHERVFYIDQDFVLPAMEDSSMMDRLQSIRPGAKWIDGVALQLSEVERDRRVLWSHMHLHFLNPKMLDTCKAVYIARNPKDVCVSYYHFLASMEGSKGRAFEGEFSNWANIFMEGKDLTYGPYWAHIQQIMERKTHKNLHIMFFEDLKKDVMGEMKKLKEFLELDLNEEQMRNARDHASFQEMKTREAQNGPVFKECQSNFYRKGQIGDWKNMSSRDLDDRMDSWISSNSADLGISFKYS